MIKNLEKKASYGYTNTVSGPMLLDFEQIEKHWMSTSDECRVKA